MDKKINTVFQTNEYAKFRKLDGNRSVTDGRVAKIKRSIETVGYIQSPLVVNEKFEVIDGQGRLEALKQLKLPVDYVIVAGAGIQECIALNINLKNWTLMDYIDSYAFTGNTSFQYLKNLHSEFHKWFELATLINAVDGTVESAGPKIKSGTFYCDETLYNNARKTLELDLSIIDLLSRVSGTKKYYINAFNYCTKDVEIDTKRLIAQLKKMGHTLAPAPTMKCALEEYERIYNHGKRSQVYIYNNYQRYNEARLASYKNRHMKGAK